jgi:hypothetical protein
MEISSQLHATAALSPVERASGRHSTEGSGRWPPEPVSTFRKKEKNQSLLPRSERRFLGRLARRLDTLTAVLSQLPKECGAIINTDDDS